MKPMAEDTSAEAERVLIELWRKADPARKFALVIDSTRTMQEFMLTGMRERHPHDSAEALHRRFARLWLGSDLARKAYGETPDDPE